MLQKSIMNLDYALENIENIGLNLQIKRIHSSLSYVENNYINENLRHLEVNGSIFINNDFTKAAGTGSKFINCNFYGSKFIASDMEFVDFSDSKFLISDNNCANTNNAISKTIYTPTIIGGSGFNSCIMRNTTIDNVTIDGSSFAMSDFSNAKIKNSIFIHSTMEDSIFINASIIDTTMSQANIDFIDFSNILEIKNLTLNVYQIPYIFGIKLTDIENGNIHLVNDKNERISYQNFVEILPSLISVFFAEQKYFPIANIYFIQNDFDKLHKILEQGFKNAISSCNLRELKYLCKLLSLSTMKNNMIFNRSKLKEFYDFIIYFINNLKNESLLQHYKLFDSQIRSYLLDNFADEEITFEIASKISDISEATKKINLFLDYTTNILKDIGLCIEFNNISISTYSDAKYKITVKSIKIFNKSFLQIENEFIDNTHKENEGWTSFQKTSIALATMAMLLTGSIQLGYLDFLKKEKQDILINKTKMPYLEIKEYLHEDSLIVKQGTTILADTKNYTLNIGKTIKLTTI